MKSRRHYGMQKFAIRNGMVVSAKISITHINVRGLVSSYTMVEEDSERTKDMNYSSMFEVDRKHTFNDKTKAKKALFQLKLKGEIK